MSEWLRLDSAPTDKLGLLWAEGLPNPVFGSVYAHKDGGRLASSPDARGWEFTHWHELPAPPEGVEDERGRPT